MRTLKSRLYRRLLLYFLAISLLPVILLGAMAIITANRLAVERIRASLVQLTETTAGILDSELLKYRNSIDIFCGDEQLRDFLELESPSGDLITQINQKVYLIMAGHANTMSFYIINTSGRFALATSYEPLEYDYMKYGNWGIFRALNQNDKTIFYPESYTGYFGREDTGITIGSKVVKNNKTIGYVMLNIRQRTIVEIIPPSRDMLVSYALSDSNFFLVLNQFMAPRSPFVPSRYRPLVRAPEPKGGAREYQEERYLIARDTLPETGLSLYAEVSTALMAKNSSFITSTVIAVMLLFVFVCIVFAHRIAKRILEPIRTICDSMEIIKTGNLDERVRISTRDEFETMAEGFNRMIEQLDTLFRTGMERQNRLRIAEIKNLQAQIAPHFLYNTLESIKWLAKLGMNSEIQATVEKLGILLKSSMNFKKNLIPLRDEMRVVASYIGIQQIRREDLFTVTMDVPENLLDCLVPNLVIQPIVENAMVHGLEEKVGAGVLKIRAFKTGRNANEDICFEISDNGPGMSREKIESLLKNENHGSDRESIGLINVDRRIKLDFGNAYGVSIRSKEGEGTVVTLTMPFQTQDPVSESLSGAVESLSQHYQHEAATHV